MELKLESTLAHQLAPVNAVATVVEASIKEQAKASHQIECSGIGTGSA